MNLQSSLHAVGESDNDTAAVRGADGKVRCINTEPEVPKCHVGPGGRTWREGARDGREGKVAEEGVGRGGEGGHIYQR